MAATHWCSLTVPDAPSDDFDKPVPLEWIPNVLYSWDVTPSLFLSLSPPLPYPTSPNTLAIKPELPLYTRLRQNRNRKQRNIREGSESATLGRRELRTCCACRWLSWSCDFASRWAISRVSGHDVPATSTYRDQNEATVLLSSYHGRLKIREKDNHTNRVIQTTSWEMTKIGSLLCRWA